MSITSYIRFKCFFKRIHIRSQRCHPIGVERLLDIALLHAVGRHLGETKMDAVVDFHFCAFRLQRYILFANRKQSDQLVRLHLQLGFLFLSENKHIRSPSHSRWFRLLDILIQQW